MKALEAYFHMDGYSLDYSPTDPSSMQYEDDVLFNAYQAQPYAALFDYGFTHGDPNRPPSLTFLHLVSRRFISP